MTLNIGTILKILRDLFPVLGAMDFDHLFQKFVLQRLSANTITSAQSRQTSSPVHRALFGFFRDSADCGAIAVCSNGPPTIAMIKDSAFLIGNEQTMYKDACGDF